MSESPPRKKDPEATINAYRKLIGSIYDKIITQCDIGIKSSKILILASTVSDRDCDLEEGAKTKKELSELKEMALRLKNNIKPLSDGKMRITEEEFKRIYGDEDNGKESTKENDE